MELDIEKIRREFPILERSIGEKPLIYLDNTATSQTPLRVVDKITSLYEHTKANVHRGVHTISQEATDLQEDTRRKIQKYINANNFEEIIFTRGTTEAINLVASSFGQLLSDGDEIILTVMEHHANIVPWQLLKSRKNIIIKVVNINEKGELDLNQYRSLFTSRTRLVSFAHVSNVLGTINPAKEIIRIAHQNGALAMVDGAQASPHLKIDVQDLDCDFYAFSSHKMYGPTGVGVLYGRKSILETMPPYQGGGEMIKHVSFEGTTYADLPFKFEAGTPDFIDIAAFSMALDFIDSIGMDNIHCHEQELLEYATPKMFEIPGLEIYGTSDDKSAVISFNVGKIHNYDLGFMLDKFGVAVRTGHHCAQPLMHRLGIQGCARASFAIYNTKSEVDKFIDYLRKVVTLF